MKIFLVAAFLLGVFVVNGQEAEKSTLAAIYKSALTSYDAYHNLDELCRKAPGRLMGSKESERAIQILKNQLQKLQPDTVYLQNFRNPSWRCKTPCQAVVYYGSKKESLRVVNLGLSVSTPKMGTSAEIIEVTSFDELDKLGQQAVNGKIVFFNCKMDNSKIRTFQGYGAVAHVRMEGAVKAAQYGAVGALVRSISTEPTDFPHTGVSRYQEGVRNIPNISISTNDADKLSRIIQQNRGVKVWIKSDTETIESVQTANVVAELKGSQHPENVILIGAHIDVWFNSPGAHDDGAGCEQMIDVLRIFKELNIKPVNTIRVVLFMDEEMFQSGSKVYAEFAGKEKKKHLAAIESDEGGLLPMGFGIDADDSVVNAFQKLVAPLVDYGIFKTEKGYAGVDIEPLKEFGIPLIGLSTNSQRYFEFHHTANDTFDMVSRREMQLGTAAIASLVYLIDRK